MITTVTLSRTGGTARMHTAEGLKVEEARCWAGISGCQPSTLRLSRTPTHEGLRWHGIWRRMAHWTAAIDGRQRNSSLHPRHCSDIFVPASCCRNWACLVAALRSALLFLYRTTLVCSCIRTRHRVQCATNSGIPLADVASDHFSRRCSCVLPVHSAVRSERPETNSALSVTVETVRRRGRALNFR